jgi:hypothetical protein
VVGRPSGTLVGISGAKSPKLKSGVDLATVEPAIIGDEWLGPKQRAHMLKELRALAAYYAHRLAHQ